MGGAGVEATTSMSCVSISNTPSRFVAVESTGAYAEFVLTRSGDVSSNGIVCVSWSGVARLGIDYNAVSYVGFGPGQVTSVLRVRPIQDGIVEGYESVYCKLEYYRPGAGIGYLDTLRNATCYIHD